MGLQNGVSLLVKVYVKVFMSPKSNTAGSVEAFEDFCIDISGAYNTFPCNCEQEGNIIYYYCYF